MVRPRPLGLRQLVNGSVQEELGQVPVRQLRKPLPPLPTTVVDRRLTHSGTLRSLSGKGEDQHVTERLQSRWGGETTVWHAGPGATTDGSLLLVPRVRSQCDHTLVEAATRWLPAGNPVRRQVRSEGGNPRLEGGPRLLPESCSAPVPTRTTDGALPRSSTTCARGREPTEFGDSDLVVAVSAVSRWGCLRSQSAST